MFTANILTVTVLSSLFGIFLVEYLENKINYHQIFKIVLLILLLFSIYNFFGGLSMIFDWEDPLANATLEQRGRAMARRRGGFVLLIIEYWPYILTIFGALHRKIQHHHQTSISPALHSTLSRTRRDKTQQMNILKYYLCIFFRPILLLTNERNK